MRLEQVTQIGGSVVGAGVTGAILLDGAQVGCATAEGDALASVGGKKQSVTCRLGRV